MRMDSVSHSTPALTIEIAVERSSASAWIEWLCRRVERRADTIVRLRLVEGGDRAAHPALGSLLQLEKMLLRRHHSCLSDRIHAGRLAEWLNRAADPTADLVIDLTSDRTASEGSTRIYRPLFNGHAGEFGLASVLFFEGTPHIEIECTMPSGDRWIVADGYASLEAAAGVGGAMEAVWSRAAILLIKALSEATHPPLLAETAIQARARPIRRKEVTVRSAKMLASAAARAAYRLCCHAPHWRIGWRRVGYENDVWQRRDLGGTPWQVLADPIDHFYADPFPFRWQGKDYLFFEDLDQKTQKGIISVVKFDEEGRPGPVIPVLEEPWHLSYPFLIEADGKIWMVPEASLSGEISIYRATRFPFGWEKHATLVSGIEAADATIIQHAGKFWMFAVTRDGIGGYSDTLCLWSAETLLGPWRPHGANPLIINDRTARPAGNMMWRDGKLLRPVQDCRNGYGAALSLAEVTRLDDEHFEQVIVAQLGPGKQWPGRKLHTLSGNGYMEAIDGSIIRPKWSFAADIVDTFYKPRA
jgi:hypothetical protein